MGKILITYILILFCCKASYAETPTADLRGKPNWQLRGMARSALRMNDHHQAAIFLEELYRRDASNTHVGMQLGNIYMETRQYRNAKDIFKKIYESDPRSQLEARFNYAFLLKMFQEYEDALEHFELLRMRARRIPGNHITRERVENLIQGCNMAIAHRDTMVHTKIERLGSTINTKQPKTGVIIINNNEFIYGSARKNTPEIIKLDKPYEPVMQFYSANFDNDQWTSNPETPAPFFNLNNYDTGRGAFSPDKQRFYISGCQTRFDGKTICHLFVSKYDNGEWSQPEKLGPTVNNPEYTSTQPTVGTTFDTNLEVLYFISDRPGGAGGMDIWFSVYNKRTGEYQQAQNAGVFINTPQDEVTPFYDVTSRRLYFSSNGLPGYGGFDIFYTEGALVTWQPPVNLGKPINSSWDDTGFVKAGDWGFLTSNRHIEYSENHIFFTPDIYKFSRTDELFMISDINIELNQLKETRSFFNHSVKKKRIFKDVVNFEE
ncbi:tetratricopeptide repeat protein [Alkalitalea saponilacus]|uniref:WD40-like Beta Propeller Repeat n=1 Tax=Alkalitalea saponilacus TaxID=889453 RepID=A0A1T5F8L7_9BACT|nr:tetratricopeptide repeat protein [Alkalitalea saponilacus]ASB50134.1 hypothetical protein CDL62_13795 [Alkalitalea saponilacus]SKB92486.1 WD40-like Beta Propeller Repeat [Alkalitalea saponilacus]